MGFYVCMYVCMYMYVCREKEAVSFLSLFYLFLSFFHIKCKIPWLLLLFMPNYAVEKDLKSICGGLFFSFKTFSTYGGIQLYTQDFQKSPSSDFIWRGTTSRDFVAPLAASRPKELAPLAKKLVKSTCCMSTFFFLWYIIKDISEFS